MADALSVIPTAVPRNLSDKLYEKRKNAAQEIEEIVKRLAMVGDHDKITTMINLLTNEFTSLPQSESSKSTYIRMHILSRFCGKLSRVEGFPALLAYAWHDSYNTNGACSTYEKRKSHWNLYLRPPVVARALKLLALRQRSPLLTCLIKARSEDSRDGSNHLGKRRFKEWKRPLREKIPSVELDFLISDSG
ncbi:hypothetical protein Syun_007614 [Stephania yunnanensis]|uniref:Uncharacterized protein n=1 Tax=Stephania yunnanensis TaxID=152371 RepID=A0AAP0PYW4_9MAGN